MHGFRSADSGKVAVECKKPVYHFGRTGGMIPSPEEIYAKITEYAEGEAK